MLFVDYFFNVIANEDASPSLNYILFILVSSLVIISFIDAVFSWLLPEVHAKGILRPGFMIINALRGRFYILREDIVHISDGFLLEYDPKRQVMILQIDAFFIYTRQRERYYIANPWKYSGVDLRPILKIMIGPTWDTVYLGLRSNSYFYNWEVDMLLNPLGIGDILRHFATNHYPLSHGEYQATCSKFISLFCSWSAFRTGIPEALHLYEHQIMMAVMQMSGVHINQLQSIPIIQETQRTLKVKNIGGYPFKSKVGTFCPDVYYFL